MTRDNKVKLFEACAKLHRFEEDMHAIGFDMFGTDLSDGKGKLFDVCEDIIIDDFGLDRTHKDIDLLIDGMLDIFMDKKTLCSSAYAKVREMVNRDYLKK